MYAYYLLANGSVFTLQYFSSKTKSSKIWLIFVYPWQLTLPRGQCDGAACRIGRRVEDYRAQVATLSLNFFYFLTPHTHHPPDLAAGARYT